MTHTLVVYLALLQYHSTKLGKFGRRFVGCPVANFVRQPNPTCHFFS